MTKAIRIENADGSDWPVRVTVQRKNAAGEWVDGPSEQIDLPTAMTTQYVHGSQRLVVEERKKGE